MVRGLLLRRFVASAGAAALALAVLFLLVALVSKSGPASAATSQGPVAEYSFDENPGEGSTLEDVSGNEHTATIHGAGWTSKGRYGGAMEFDGEDDYLSVPASEELDLTEEFTLEAWVHPEAVEEYATILGKENSVSPHFAYIAYAQTPAERPEAFFAEGEKGYLEGSSGAAPLHAWTHIAVTDDGAHNRLYVDGILVDTEPAVPIPTTDGELVIGGNKAFSAFLDGRIDEVRIYDRALAGAEVDSDMATPIQTPQVGPVAEYSFDEGEGTTVEDLTGDGHTATIEGAEWSSRGKYGGAMSFDGEGAALSVPASPELDLTEEFTLEAWVHPEKIREFDDIFSKENSKSPVYGYLIADHHTQLASYFQQEPEYATYSPGEGAIVPHIWTHLAVTDDGGHVRIFIDGVQVERGPAPKLISTDGELRIGGSGFFGPEDDFDGRIDEVRVYNRALNASEVGADMEAPIQTPRAGPVAAYSFDEGETAVESVEDVSGNEHTATIEDGEWARGRYGGGIKFDGSGGEECISVPDSSELHLSEEFTLESWVRPEGGVYEDPVIVRESGGKTVFGLGLGSREEGKAEGFIGEGGGSEAAVGGETGEKAWAHVATTYDGAKIRVYVEGELVATESAATPAATGEGALKIGCDGPDGQFTGSIDEVRVYDRALDAAEVAGDMESPLQTPKATPVAAYSFDEENSETATDTTGDGHTATVEGAGWTAHGRYGGAMEFDASKEDVLKIPASSELDFGEEFTLEAWVRPSGGDNRESPLIDKQAGVGLGYFLYEGGTVSDRPVGAANEEQENVSASDPLPSDAWSHVAMVFTGNRTYLYIDGQEVQNGAAEPFVDPEGELEIGGSTDTSDFFDGRIDEVRIYNRGLDPAEVAADMEAPIQTPKRGPVAAWSFDEGEGTTVEDLTGDGHEATVEGPGWANGKYGDSLHFDGENDCVSIEESEDLRFDEEFTLETWVRPDVGSPAEEPIIVQEDEAAAEGEEPYAYALVGGGESSAAGWVRITGEHEYQGIYGDGSLPEDAWSHIALTDDGAHLRLYQDGELVRTVAAPVLTGADGPLTIGCDKTFGAFFQGRIDEVRVYNRALNDSEVGASLGALPRALTDESESESTEAVLLGTVNPMGKATSYRFEYGLTSGYGQSIPESADESERWVTGSEPEEVDQAIDELEPETTYHYRIVATNVLGTIVGQDKTFTTTVAELAPLAKGSFSGGVGVNWSGRSTTSSEMSLVNESGAQMFRVVIYPGCPGVGGNVKSQEDHNDNVFLTLAQDHITVLPDVSGIPCRGGKNQLPALTKGSVALGRWETGLKALVKRYGPDGVFWESHTALKSYAPTYWEIWNEENVERNAADTGQIIPQRYGRLLEVSHDALAEVDGKAKVLFGGLLTIGETNLKAPKNRRKEEREMTIRRFVKEAGHSEDYDAVSLHPYAYLGSVTQVVHNVKLNIQAARFTVNKFGGGKGKEIWVTEIGWPVEGLTEPDEVHQSVSPAVQEERLNSVFEKIKEYSGKYNIGNIFWYNIQDISGSGWAEHCGLVGKGGGKRSSFAAFQGQAE